MATMPNSGGLSSRARTRVDPNFSPNLTPWEATVAIRALQGAAV